MPKPFDCRTRPIEHLHDLKEGVWDRPWEQWTYAELAVLHRECPMTYALLLDDYHRRTGRGRLVRKG